LKADLRDETLAAGQTQKSITKDPPLNDRSPKSLIVLQSSIL